MTVQMVRAKFDGFTLSELLLVVSILLVLSGFLLMASQGSRERAKRATCTSNLRQIMLATQMYCDEHGGYFPTFSLQTSETLFPYLKIKDTTEIAGTKHVFYCPSAASKPLITMGSTNVALVPGGEVGGAFTFCGGKQCYGYNVNLQPGYVTPGNTWVPAAYPGLRKISDVSSPTHVLWAMDVASHWINQWCAGNAPHFRHGDGFNAAFVDGHVNWVPWATWESWWDAGFPQAEPYSWW